MSSLKDRIADMLNNSSTATHESSFSILDATNPQDLNRACESCRQLKVRCLLDSASTTAQCQRCARANRSCVFAAPQRRRPRKRMDARVAELERELNAMRLLLKKGGGSNVVESTREEKVPEQGRIRNENPPRESNEDDTKSTDKVESPDRRTDYNFCPAPVTRKSPKDALQAETRNGPFMQSETTSDVIDRGVLSMDTATQLIDRYINEITPHYPAVILREETTALELRKSKPILFLAAIAAAALGWNDANLARFLFDEIRRLYADRIFIKGEKSLELVQSLLITVAYYYPPDSPGKLPFYQYTHIAAAMALDIGIGSKSSSGEAGEATVYTAHTGDICRAILTCYLLTSSIALKMRRPPMLQFNDWMAECLNLLEKSPLDLERRFAAWIKLQRIADDALTSYGFDDPSTNISLAESRMQVVVKAFERRMEDWKRETSPDLLSVTLTIEYHQNCISVYEFVMAGGKHNSHEFKQQHFNLPSLDEPASTTPKAPPTAAQINATMKCISSAHAVLESFLSLDGATMRTVPGALYVRATFALVDLLKVSFEVSKRDDGFGELIDPAELNIDLYLRIMWQRLKDAVGGPSNCRVPSHWLTVMERVQEWHEKHQDRLRLASIQGQSEVFHAPPVQTTVDPTGPDRSQHDSLARRSQDNLLFSTLQGSDNFSFVRSAPVASIPDAETTGAWTTMQTNWLNEAEPQRSGPGHTLPELRPSSRSDAAMEWEPENDNGDRILFNEAELMGDIDLFRWIEDGNILNDWTGEAGVNF